MLKERRDKNVAFLRGCLEEKRNENVGANVESSLVEVLPQK